MKKVTGLLILIMAAALLAGCPKKPTIVKEEAKAPAVDAEKQKAEAKTKEDVAAKAKAEAAARAKAEAEAKARAEAEAAAKAKAEADAKAREEAAKTTAEAKAKEEFRLEDIHFDLDKYDIKEKDREILNSLGEWLAKNKNVKIQIEGHCDERGTNEYNLALGDRRANNTKQYLVTLGVSAGRISTVSYGEEKPLCEESNEDCWFKNRRGHFVIQEQR